MITEQQIDFYRENGFVTVEGVLSPAEVQGLRDATDRMVEAARGLTTHDEVYDLEDTHRPDDPRVRRIKMPHLRDAAYGRLIAQANVVAAAAAPDRQRDPLRHLEAQPQGRGLRRRRRVAPGLGLLSAHQRRSLRRGLHARRLRHGERPAALHPRQPQGPCPRPPRRRSLLRRHRSRDGRRRPRPRGRPAQAPRARSRSTMCGPCTARPRTARASRAAFFSINTARQTPGRSWASSPAGTPTTRSSSPANPPSSPASSASPSACLCPPPTSRALSTRTRRRGRDAISRRSGRRWRCRAGPPPRFSRPTPSRYEPRYRRVVRPRGERSAGAG